MPKGVEHNRYGYKLGDSDLVIYPLMPKGVEHPLEQLAYMIRNE